MVTITVGFQHAAPPLNTLQRSSPSNRFSNLGELSDCTTIWNFRKKNKQT
jgi:hypothetical protein